MLPTGFISQELKLALFDSAERELPSQTLTIFGTVNEKIVALPEKVNFGPLSIGSTATQTIVLSAQTAQPFELGKIEVPPHTEIVGSKFDGADCRITLRQPVS